MLSKAIGHRAQTGGLLAHLGTALPGLEVAQIEVSPTIRGWQRSLAQWRMDRVADSQLMRWAGRHHADLTLPSKAPDFVIASGGEGYWLMNAVGRAYQVPRIHVGFPPRFPKNWCDLQLSPIPLGADQLVIETGRLLTQMTPGLVDQAARDAGESVREENVWAVLIGGCSRSHNFTAEDWRDLAAGMNSLGERGIRFLVTTSRRTGADVEALLQSEIRPEYLLEAVWWSQAPRKIMKAFMGRAERLIVTRDSLTMVTEALDSGRPTIAVSPKGCAIDGKSHFGRYLARMEETPGLLICPCHEIAEILPEQLAQVESAQNAFLSVAIASLSDYLIKEKAKSL